MPALIFVDSKEDGVGSTWVCSDCNLSFAAASSREQLSASDCRRINRQFTRHCRRQHPKAVIVDLENPSQQRASLLNRNLWKRIIERLKSFNST